MWFESMASEASRLGLTLRWGTVPARLAAEPEPHRRVQVAGAQVLVRLDGGWSLLANEGADIVLQGPHELDPGDATERGKWVVDTWAIPVAMMQRGWLILHASTVSLHGATIAVAGNSGAGKSTTAWGLRERGHGLLVDDATVCEITADGVVVHPFRRRLNLTDVATAHFGIPREHTSASSTLSGKVSITPHIEHLDSQILHHIVVLNRLGVGESITSEPVTGAARLPLLTHLTTRGGLAPRIMGKARFFDAVVAMAQLVDITRLSRPADSWTLDEAMDAIEGVARRLSA